MGKYIHNLEDLAKAIFLKLYGNGSNLLTPRRHGNLRYRVNGKGYMLVAEISSGTDKPGDHVVAVTVVSAKYKIGNKVLGLGMGKAKTIPCDVISYWDSKRVSSLNKVSYPERGCEGESITAAKDYIDELGYRLEKGGSLYVMSTQSVS